MSKKDLNLNWTSDAKAVERDAAKMAEKIENLETKLKQVSKQARKSKEEFHGMSGSLKKVGEIAAGVFSAQALTSGFRVAMDLLKAEFEDMLAKQQRAAQQLTNSTRNTADYTTNWLGAGSIDAVMQVKDDVKIRGLLDTDKDLILSKYAGANENSTLAQGKTALETLGKAKGMTNLGELSGFYGELEQLYGADKSSDDIADLAFGMRQEAGKRAGELEAGMKGVHKLTAMGVDKDKAVAMLMAGANTEQGSRGINTLASLLARPRKEATRKPGANFTAAQKLQNEVAGLNDQEYLEWMIANPDKAKVQASSSWAAVAPLFQDGVISHSREQLATMQSSDVFSRNVKDFRSQKYVQAAILSDDVAADIGEDRRKRNLSGALAGKVRAEIATYLDDMGSMSKFQKDWIQKKLDLDGLYGDDYTSGVIRTLEGIRATAAAPVLLYGGHAAKNPKYDKTVESETSELIKSILQMKNSINQLAQLQQESNKINKKGADAAEKTAENTAQTANPVTTGGE